ncbi:hypothetical protein ABZ351_30350 [Streptomyces microflavus]|uniref:hypothetical protein n=1 Tax=Streptomyces microflavus TaxID=1919 RepID=UPI0033E6BDDC
MTEDEEAYERLHELTDLAPGFAIRTAVTLGLFDLVRGGAATLPPDGTLLLVEQIRTTDPDDIDATLQHLRLACLFGLWAPLAGRAERPGGPGRPAGAPLRRHRLGPPAVGAGALRRTVRPGPAGTGV